jgi:ribonucleoside-diphosphate reductase alpha chain
VTVESNNRKGRGLRLTDNAVRILKARYLKKDELGNVLETPEEMFLRVASAVASAETEREHWAEVYYDMMTGLDFLPNSPCLMNAGRELGQLAACFVLPIDDSMESIFETLKNAALIHKSGGGTGFSFSRLRPRNSIVGSTHGISSGPVSFIKVYDRATEEIKQGGTRRGANMGVLRVDHPDILEFITCKEEEGRINNFNLSVAITDEFMEALFNDSDYPLVDPHTGRVTERLAAGEVFRLITECAWMNGEPGIIFIDTINRNNPLEDKIESTNPCGEQPLLPYESCNLGSVNLANLVDDSDIDWARLEEVVRHGVRFLDNVIDINVYPIPEIEEATLKTRKIGLGVMGFADMLLKLKVKYDSEEGLKWAERVMSFVADRAERESMRLAEEKGNFPAIGRSVYKGGSMRNACRTTIAPTGTIARIAGTSSGIEPNFSWKTVSHILDGVMTDYHPLARLYLENNEPLPEHFVTATEISPDWHIRMQAAFQKHVDAAVSKTINFATGASREDVADAFILAHRMGLKGLTVYREGSRKREVLV